MKMINKLALVLMASTAINAASAEEIQAAVAANFTAAMKDIVAKYEEQSENTVALSFGSSGKILAQIQNGAPFQIFFSADQAKPEALEQAGLTVEGSRYTYAIGSLALWSVKADFVDADLTRLKSGDYNKLALANPKLAPYGQAAIETLEALDLTQATQDKWVQGENIAQTYQFVATGNADMGFVALSQIMDKGHVSEGSSWIVPSALYNPIRQDAVILKIAQDNEAVKDFMNYMQSDTAHAIIQSYGYKTE
ncbi:MAG: molybdate ABC transporter substrate-binding protein [Alphaproteobacteria bacterium]